MRAADTRRVAVPGLATAGSPFSRAAIDSACAFLSGIVASDVPGGAEAHGDLARETEIDMTAPEKRWLGLGSASSCSSGSTCISRMPEFDRVYPRFFPSGAFLPAPARNRAGLAGGSSLEITVMARL